MKTLKLQLLAASMFACTAAFAQANNAPVITAPGPNSGAALNAMGGTGNMSQDSRYNTSRAGYINDSYVLQQGANQYSRVDQSANGSNDATSGANQADIIQGPNGNGNNAFQTQNYTGTGGAAKNVGYIYQNGTNGSATQEQDGSSNTASVRQYGANSGGAADGNTAYQRQSGVQNSAEIQQSGGSRDQAIQFQSAGPNNVSTINQYAGNLNRAQTDQQGSFNTAVVTQH